MPQLMPLYWILSSIMVILFLMMIMKIYGNYVNYNYEINNMNYENINSKWYW